MNSGWGFTWQKQKIAIEPVIPLSQMHEMNSGWGFIWQKQKIAIPRRE